jgi:two-component system, sensor histidine kinase
MAKRKKKRKTAASKHARGARKPPRRAAVDARAVDATLADLAHEIRTPLTGILALGELLSTSDCGERERGWAAAIKGTAEHLAMLTSLIVDAAPAHAKGLVLRRELVRPRRLAEAVGATLRARAEAKGLKAEVVVAENLPEAVIGDGLRLRAVLENLIDNAVKFTEHGGVRLDVSCEAAARSRVRLVFTVSDSGPGLTSAETKRLFRPFAQANAAIARHYGGAGLGLAFAKRVAKAMGGNLTVVSKPGSGSSFKFAVPADAVVEVDAAPGNPAAARGMPLASLRILCVEDNPYGRIVLNTILTELGHRADFVGTGEAAVEAVAHGRYDVVLIDVTLPGIDGIEATRRIRALGNAAGEIAIVGVSGRANAADEALGRAAGMDGYLTKPLSPSALTRVLASLSPRAPA